MMRDSSAAEKIENEQVSSEIGFKNWIGWKRECPTNGAMVKQRCALQAMPDEGSTVKFYSSNPYSRYRGNEGRGNLNNTYKEPYPSRETSVFANELVWKVVSYSFGIEQPYHPKNKVNCECIYPSNCTQKRLAIPTSWIAGGYLHVEIFTDKSYETKEGGVTK